MRLVCILLYTAGENTCRRHFYRSRRTPRHRLPALQAKRHAPQRGEQGCHQLIQMEAEEVLGGNRPGVLDLGRRAGERQPGDWTEITADAAVCLRGPGTEAAAGRSAYFCLARQAPRTGPILGESPRDVSGSG